MRRVIPQKVLLHGLVVRRHACRVAILQLSARREPENGVGRHAAGHDWPALVKQRPRQRTEFAECGCPGDGWEDMGRVLRVTQSELWRRLLGPNTTML